VRFIVQLCSAIIACKSTVLNIANNCCLLGRFDSFRPQNALNVSSRGVIKKSLNYFESNFKEPLNLLNICFNLVAAGV
jgi:hypothetical protein